MFCVSHTVGWIPSKISAHVKWEAVPPLPVPILLLPAGGGFSAPWEQHFRGHLWLLQEGGGRSFLCHVKSKKLILSVSKSMQD